MVASSCLGFQSGVIDDRRSGRPRQRGPWTNGTEVLWVSDFSRGPGAVNMAVGFIMDVQRVWSVIFVGGRESEMPYKKAF